MSKPTRKQWTQLETEVRSDDRGKFDEFVLKTGRPHGCAVHVEMLGPNHFFVSVGNVMLWANIEKDGTTTVLDIEDHRGK